MKKERSLKINSILSDLDSISLSAKRNLADLNSDIINDTYSNGNLEKVKLNMALTNIDDDLFFYIIEIAKKKFGINIDKNTVAEMFRGREEKIVPVRFLVSEYKREIFAMDAISYYFIGSEMSQNRVSDTESISYEIKMAAMEAGFNVDGVFFMNREL